VSYRPPKSCLSPVAMYLGRRLPIRSRSSLNVYCAVILEGNNSRSAGVFPRLPMMRDKRQDKTYVTQASATPIKFLKPTPSLHVAASISAESVGIYDLPEHGHNGSSKTRLPASGRTYCSCYKNRHLAHCRVCCMLQSRSALSTNPIDLVPPGASSWGGPVTTHIQADPFPVWPCLGPIAPLRAFPDSPPGGGYCLIQDAGRGGLYLSNSKGVLWNPRNLSVL
jgi:hypothetical protein